MFMTALSVNLWFAEHGLLAAEHYCAIIPGAEFLHHRTLHGTPGGSADVTTIAIPGIGLQCLTAQPGFPLNPAITLSARCRSRQGALALWQAISSDGVEMMPFQEYPFSPLFGWCTDRFGVSWQVQFEPNATTDVEVVPVLMFVGSRLGLAEQAARHYCRSIPDSNYSTEDITLYGVEAPFQQQGMVMLGECVIAGSRVAFMDSPGPHDFTFNEGTSLVVTVAGQQEIDMIWTALSAVPEAEQCGWLKDAFGVSWQIVPTDMDRIMRTADDEALARVVDCFLPMRKFDVAALRAAERGEGR